MPLDKAWRRPFEYAGDTPRHEFLYDMQAALKIFTALAFAATLVFTFQGWPGTFFVAVLFAVACTLWMVSVIGEHRARKGLAGPVTEAEAHAQEEAAGGAAALTARLTEREVVRAELKFGLEILAALVLAAVVAAVLFFRDMIGLGIVLVFAYLAAFGAPYWIAAIHERGDEEKERIAGS